LKCRKAHLDFTVPVFHHRQEELIHDPFPIFGKEEIGTGVRAACSMLSARPFQSGVVDRRNPVEVAHPMKSVLLSTSVTNFWRSASSQLAIGYVSNDFEAPTTLPESSRIGEMVKDMNVLAVASPPHGFKMFDPLAGFQTGYDLVFFGDAFRRNDQRDMFAHASSAAKPKSCSAAFQLWIIPSGFADDRHSMIRRSRPAVGP
jgi:hypothetical protein